MIKVKLGEVTVNLDNRRKPLNNVQRQEKSVVKKYAYCGANNIVDYIDDYIFDETDEILCIAEDGGSWGKEEKCTYIMREKCWVNNHAHVIKMNEGVDINYISLFLNYTDLTSYITGSTRGKLTKSSLENIELDLPDYEAQVGISKKILSIQDLMEKKEKQLAKLNELVKSRFHEMFGDKYSEDTLLNLCNIIDYRGKTPEKVESGLPFITAKNVKMHYMSLEPREYISKEIYDKVMVRGFPKEGDVLFTTEAPLGNVCRIPNFDTEFYIGQRIVTIQTDKLNSTYLEYALSDKEFIKKYMGKSSGSTVKGIRVRLLEQLTIPVPPRVLQDEFATFVLQVDKSQLAIKNSLEELETLKKSLMQAYFG